MLNAGGNKGKSERRGRKAESRKQTGGQQSLEAEPRPDQVLDAQEQINEQISAPVASIDQLQDARTGQRAVAHRSRGATSLLLKLQRLTSSRPFLPYRPSPSWPALQSPMPMAPTPGNRSS